MRSSSARERGGTKVLSDPKPPLYRIEQSAWRKLPK